MKTMCVFTLFLYIIPIFKGYCRLRLSGSGMMPLSTLPCHVILCFWWLARNPRVRRSGGYKTHEMLGYYKKND